MERLCWRSGAAVPTVRRAVLAGGPPYVCILELLVTEPRCTPVAAPAAPVQTEDAQGCGATVGVTWSSIWLRWTRAMWRKDPINGISLLVCLLPYDALVQVSVGVKCSHTFVVLCCSVPEGLVRPGLKLGDIVWHHDCYSMWSYQRTETCVPWHCDSSQVIRSKIYYQWWMLCR